MITFYKYSIENFIACVGKTITSEGKCQSALYASFGLGKVQGAAVPRDEGSVSLGQKIAHVNQGFHAIRKHVAVYGLAKVKTEIWRGQRRVKGGDHSDSILRLPAIRCTPLRAGMLHLPRHAC